MAVQKSFPRGYGVFSGGKTTVLFVAPFGTKEKSLSVIESQSGLYFKPNQERFFVTKSLGIRENLSGVSDMSIVGLPDSDEYFLTYTRKRGGKTFLYGAYSKNALAWKKTGLIDGIHSFGTLIPEYAFEGHAILYFSANGRSIKMALSENLRQFDVFHESVLEPRKKSFDYGSLSVGRVFLTDEGVALFYLARNIRGKLCLGAALFDKMAPAKLLWRSSHPLWEQPDHWKTADIRLVGIVSTKNGFTGYFQEGKRKIFAEPLRYVAKIVPKFLKKIPAKKKKAAVPPSTLTLKRHPNNPILAPRLEHAWESVATFNPAALHIDGVVHLLYRAQGHDGLSVLGYAASLDGICIHHREPGPVFIPSRSFEKRHVRADLHPYAYVSGGGYGGCEDPRIVRIGDTIYLIYVAFDGANPPGVALSSIATQDFLAKHWHWTPPRLISRPGQIQKNWVIFPEKIRGKYAVLHGISPDVKIEYVESLDDLGHGNYIESLVSHGGGGYVQPDRRNQWDNIIRGVGAPPLRTDRGWLVFYHAMDYRDPGKYKVGVMLLDLRHPEKVMRRADQPILEPEMTYENDGNKSGVVYVCGSVIKDGTLLVYYGASDHTVAVAAAPIDEFLSRLMTHQPIQMKAVTLR
jgi:predicted GH43/DUF377 family glycosyl hydrolase